MVMIFIIYRLSANYFRDLPAVFCSGSPNVQEPVPGIRCLIPGNVPEPVSSIYKRIYHIGIDLNNQNT